jgi:hypothetical protein
MALVPSKVGRKGTKLEGAKAHWLKWSRVLVGSFISFDCGIHGGPVGLTKNLAGFCG